MDIENNVIELKLSVKRIIRGKEKIIDENLVPCIVQLTFQQLIEVSLIDKFPTKGSYLEFIISFQQSSNEVSLSINFFDNSSHVYEKPNWVIKAKRVSWQEV